MSERLPKEYAILREKYKKLETENKALATRNNELEDLRRWRDAKKEPPPQKEGYSWSDPVQVLMPPILGDIEIHTGTFDHSPVAENGGLWFHVIGNNWFHTRPIAWRPLDLPEAKGKSE